MISIRENVPLAPLTTLGVGGPARCYAEAAGEEDVREAVKFAGKKKLDLFVLGGGSNLVVADAGWPGMVLRIAIPGIESESAADKTVFHVGAGEDWDGFVAQAVSANCAGIECLSGIPGTVGGTPVQNVGAYGQEVSESILSVRVLDRHNGKVRDLSNADCSFAYRTSLFNTAERGRYIVLRVSYALRPDGVPELKYADLKQHFEGQQAPSLQQAREAVREIRHRKAMLLVEGDPDAHSAGSFFKNPIVSETQFMDLSQRLAVRGIQLAGYSAGDGMRKISAACLIENAGFRKGYTLGRAGISRKHALAIVNMGEATAAEILALKDKIQSSVLETFGIDLHPEPVFVGF